MIPQYFRFQEKVLKISKKPKEAITAPSLNSFKQEYLTVVTNFTIEVINYIYLTISQDPTAGAIHREYLAKPFFSNENLSFHICHPETTKPIKNLVIIDNKT